MPVQVEVSTNVEQASPAHVLVVGARKIVESMTSSYDKELQRYNKRLRLLTEDRLVLRSRHSSGGKDYHSRYFYERYWCDKDNKIKQKFVGKVVPEDWVPTGGFPSAPVNPIEGLECSLIGGNAIMRADMYERFIRLFVGHFVTPMLAWSDN